jgi:hypothetical protein
MTMESDREVIALSHGGLEKRKDGRYHRRRTGEVRATRVG